MYINTDLSYHQRRLVLALCHLYGSRLSSLWQSPFASLTERLQLSRSRRKAACDGG